MPIHYTIDPAAKMVFTTATGTLTDEELMAHKRTLMADPAFRPDYRQLSDVRGVADLQITPDGIRRFSQHDASHSDKMGPHRLAIVASEDVVFGMARMYQTMTGAHAPNVAIFRTLEDARAWLERP